MTVARAKAGSLPLLPLLPLLVLLLLCCTEHAVPCSAYEYGSRRSYRHHGRSRFSSPSSSSWRMETAAVIRGDAAGKGVDDDEGFGAEKRRVYTGPNPLHNR